MLVLEVLIFKLVAVDGLTSGTVATGEVTTLSHETRDHSMEGRALEVERLARASSTLFSSAKSAEIFCCFRCVGIQSHGNTPSSLASDRHIEEDRRVNFGILSVHIRLKLGGSGCSCLFFAITLFDLYAFESSLLLCSSFLSSSSLDTCCINLHYFIVFWLNGFFLFFELLASLLQAGIDVLVFRIFLQDELEVFDSKFKFVGGQICLATSVEGLHVFRF